MNVSIIGTGSVGSALAEGLGAAGHSVVLGSRDPDTARSNGATVTTQRDAAERGDVVVLALPAGVAADVAADLQTALAGKPVVDAANEYPTATSHRSLAERVADAVPDARVVKAFNAIGANRMTDPVIDGERATMFLAGDDEDALTTVATLADDLGFEPLVAGDLSAAGHLEGLARFWIHLSQTHGRDIAFRLLREEHP
ncbi:MAG: NADPH-dependent F420 reductase [Halorubrum sp.]